MPIGIYKHPPQCGFQKGHPNYGTQFKKGHKIPRGTKHPGWKGGKTKRACIICGKEFKDYLSRKRKYCSKKCYWKSLIGKRSQNWKRIKKSCIVCGKEFYIQRYRKDVAKFCSYECVGKWDREFRVGKRHPNWKGGITPLVMQIRHCPEYHQWRLDVFTRDDYTCQICGKRGGKIEADHYPKSFSDIFHENKIETLEQALKCEEFWNINNGRTLCLKCHNRTKNNKNKKLCLVAT